MGKCQQKATGTTARVALSLRVDSGFCRNDGWGGMDGRGRNDGFAWHHLRVLTMPGVGRSCGGESGYFIVGPHIPAAVAFAVAGSGARRDVTEVYDK